jgi:hypothetical protein
MSSAAKTASNALVNRESRVPEQTRQGGDSLSEVPQQIAGGLGGPCPARRGAHPEQMRPAGAMLDRDQNLDPLEDDGLYLQQVHGQDGPGLRGEDLAPTRSGPAWHGIDADVVQNLPHRGGGDAMARAGPVHPARAGAPNSGSR